MLLQDGTIIDESGTLFDEAAPGEHWALLQWSLIAFALGTLSAWIGALAWIAVRFLTT